MPEDAPTLKVEATRGYGAEIVMYDRYAQQRTALQRQPAGPVRYGGEQETGDGGGDIAEHQLVKMPAQRIGDERLGQMA